MNFRFNQTEKNTAECITGFNKRNTYETSVRLRKNLKNQEISRRFQSFKKNIQTASLSQQVFSSDNQILSDQINTLELQLLKSNPDYQELIASGTINTLANHLQVVKNSEEFQAIITNLVNFSTGPKFCSEYLEKMKVIQSVIKKMELVEYLELAGWVVLFFSNLITSFDGFFAFMKADGILKVKNFAQSFGFGGDILKYIGCLCYNLSFFSSELGEFDGKIMLSLIDKCIESGDQQEMMVDTLFMIVDNPSTVQFTEVIISFLLDTFSHSEDPKKIALLMKIIENSSVNSFHLYNKEEFYQICLNVEKILSYSKLRITVYEMLKSLLKHEENASIVLNSNFFLELSKGLCLNDCEVRLASLKFFKKLFKSWYCSNEELSLNCNFYSDFFTGFEKIHCPDEIYLNLKLLRTILSIPGLLTSMNVLHGDSFSDFILELISKFLTHPNTFIVDEMINIQELLTI